MIAGRFLMLLGVALFLVGAALWKAPWLLSWFGHLPGDINYQSERSSVFAPIGSMLILSLMASLVMALFRH